MSYFFPHDTREAKRKETVEVFNQHYQAIVDIEQRLLGEFQALTPLWEVLILIRMSSDREEVLGDWTYEEWSRIYTVNGWTEVQGQKWYQTKTKPISGDVDNLKFEGFEEQTLVEGSEHWNEFIKTIDGVEYRNSFPVDKQKYWECLWWSNAKNSFERRLNLVIDSSYDVDCLEYYSSIYIHEAFLIMMGVSPDNMDRNEFRRWVIDSMAIELNEADYYETKEDWFKKDFKEFKDLQGKTLKPSEWLQVEQEMIDHFAAATKDYQWIHVDQQRAEKESPYKSTIAHGFMSISLIPKFLTEVLDVSSLKMAYNYGLEEVRFPYPVVEGSLLRGIIHVESIEEQKFKSLKVIWKIIVEIKGVRKPACVAKMITIVYE